MLGSLLETGMLICWGCSWPFQVVKTYKSKSIQGKSMRFCWLVWLGYIFGIFYKLFYHLDYVIFFYFLNLIFVSVDMSLYYFYKHKYKTNIE